MTGCSISSSQLTVNQLVILSLGQRNKFITQRTTAQLTADNRGESRPERTTLRPQPSLQALCAIAIVTRPVLRSIQIAATAPRMSILDLQQIEVLFPVRALFIERRRTITNLHPLHRAVLELPRLRHVSQVLVARHRSSSERSLLDRPIQRFFASRLHFRCDKVSHGRNCTILSEP